MSEERPELKIDLSKFSAERAEQLAWRLHQYAPQVFEVVKLSEKEVKWIYTYVEREYSEDRWITFIDPFGDTLPEDTFEAGYDAALAVMWNVLRVFLNDGRKRTSVEETNDEA